MFVVVILAALVPAMFCQGGMAELKSITGDEPYTGVGNAPAPVPRPMGFWGRPRYSPMGYRGAYMGNPCYSGYGSAYGGFDPCVGAGGLGGMSRYTSVGYSPYGEDGRLPFGDLFANAIMGVADPLSQPPRSSAVHSSLFNSPYENVFPSRKPGSFGSSSGKINTFSSSNPSGLSGSIPLSQATGGGFYTGKGNEMIGH